MSEVENLKLHRYVVCSKSIRIGIVVVVHWVRCVCNHSRQVRTCLSNSSHKLQVAAFARLPVVGRGSNTCVCVIAIFTMCESTEQRICIKFCFKIGKTATETYQLLQQAYVGGPQKTGFSLKKKRFIYISYKKHLIPFKILHTGGNTLVQSFFPPCEASLELLKLDVVECLLRSCIHLLHGGKSLSFQCFFHCRE